jgi:hypothetical protein
MSQVHSRVAAWGCRLSERVASLSAHPYAQRRSTPLMLDKLEARRGTRSTPASGTMLDVLARRRHGRAAARSGPRRPRHQRRDGAGQARRHQPARARRADRPKLERWRGHERSRSPARLHQHPPRPTIWRDELRTILAEGGDYGRSALGNGNERVNVEYVSANPTGPMHMGHCRGAVVGDALAQPARGAGFRSPRILCQRRRRAGRRARPLGPPALPRGARRGDRRDSRGLLSRRLSEARRRRARRRIWRALRRRPEGEWLPLFRRRDRGDARPDPADLALLGSTTTSSRPSARCRNRARSTARWRAARERPGLRRHAERRPRASTADDWEPVELTPVPLDRSSATTRTGR